MSEYKRLTRKDEKGRWVAEAGFYGIYLDNVQPKGKDMVYGELIDRLAELENKIESGVIVELPKKEAYVARDGGLTVRVVYRGEEGRVHFEYCNSEQQADEFLEKETARLKKGASR